MKKFNTLKFIIRMLKVGAWLTAGLTVVTVAVITLTLSGDLLFGYAYTLERTLTYMGGTLLGLGLGLTAGLITALLIYGAAELLDLMITIQENTYSSANVMRNLYRDQLNAQNTQTIQHADSATVRLRDVTLEGDVVEADLPVLGNDIRKGA